jgi:hypothetical protein
MGTRSGIVILKRLAVIFLVIAAGCRGNSGPERISVSGKVTFQGQPVEDGQIRFVPQAGTIAPVTIEAIKKGVYDTVGSGGVPVGTHRVEIRGYDPKEPAPKGPGSPPRKQRLPAKYNSSTQLEITIPPGSRPIVKDFELTN